jgi:hypothetical protein
MGGGGSKSAEPAAPPPAPASKLSSSEQLQLKVMRQRVRLTKERERLAAECRVHLQQAAEAKSRGDKDAALAVLKMHILKERWRAQLDKQVTDLEEVELRIQQGRLNVEVLAAMEAGAAAIEEIHREMPVSRAEAIMGRTQDAMQYASELDGVFSRELVRAPALQADLDRALAELGLLEGSPAAAALSSGAAAADEPQPLRKEGEGDAASFAFDMPLPPQAGELAAGAGAAAAAPSATRGRAGSPARARVLVPAG